MRVIFATDAIKYPLTGVGRYALELALQLEQSPDIKHLLFFNRLKINASIPDYLNNSSISYKVLQKQLCRSNLLIETYRIILPLLQGCALHTHRDYIYHSPNYCLPACMPRSIVTFHDASIFICPKYHPPERVRYLSKVMLSSLYRASRILTVSNFSQKELASYFNYPLKKIDITSLAYNKSFYPRTKEEVTPAIAQLGLKYRGYALFTGTIEPRKNVLSLITAYNSLSMTLKQFYPLVIIGHTGWNSYKEHCSIKYGVDKGWINYLGYVSQRELPILFAAARLFIFPSLYEGFGLPVLEAMASGVPLVCSNISSLLELTHDVALTCNPLDIGALRTKIEQGLQDETWRTNAINAGLTRARTFSWQRCAKETIQAYTKV